MKFSELSSEEQREVEMHLDHLDPRRTPEDVAQVMRTKDGRINVMLKPKIETVIVEIVREL